MTVQHLSDAEFAELFIHDHRVSLSPGDKAIDLLDDVERWLADGGMSHRSSMAVARAVERLAKQIAAPSPEIRADETWTQANRESYGDPQLPSAEQINAMNMEEFAAARAELGVAKPTLLEFLGGR